MRKYGGGGGFLKRSKLTSFGTFSINLFDDTSKHEILQVKMAKIALTVQKKSCNLAALHLGIRLRKIKLCYSKKHAVPSLDS